MKRLALSLAAFSILLLARAASADTADDDDGFVESGKTEAPTATTSPAPVADPAPALAPAPVAARAPSHTFPIAMRAKSQTPMRDQAPDEDPHRGLLGPVRFGALAGVGAPSLFTGEVIAKIGDYVGLAGDYGVAPTLPFPVGGTAVTLAERSFTGSLRVYPFRGAFFIGAGAGSQTVTATVAASAQGNTAAANFSTSIFFLEPELGILYRSSSGISLGCDLGVEFPMTAQRTNSQKLPEAMDQMMKYAEKGPIPTVNILRVGYVL